MFRCFENPVTNFTTWISNVLSFLTVRSFDLFQCPSLFLCMQKSRMRHELWDEAFRALDTTIYFVFWNFFLARLLVHEVSWIVLRNGCVQHQSGHKFVGHLLPATELPGLLRKQDCLMMNSLTIHLKVECTYAVCAQKNVRSTFGPGSVLKTLTFYQKVFNLMPKNIWTLK